MENLILIVILAFIVGIASGYIYVQKKKGRKCIGCPDSGKCNGGCCNSKK